MSFETIRVLSYNIHKGFSSGNRRFVLKAMKEVIHSVDADIVFLQEVLGQHHKYASSIREWPTDSQFEFLADKIWPHHAYGKNAVYGMGHHGNALLSKFNILEWSNEDISTHRLENRGLLHAELRITDALKIHCFCIHFGLTKKGRKIQLERLCERIADTIPKNSPLIVAGDFNDWLLSASKLLRKELGLIEAFKASRGRHVATFPAVFPVLRLDRIYVRGFEIEKAWALHDKRSKKLSDHVPVCAELKLRGL